MRMTAFMPKLVIMVSGLLLMSCLLPGMIPLPDGSDKSAGPMPTMEEDSDKIIEVLNAGDYIRLESLAAEQYTEEDFSKPGRLNFTAELTDDKPVFFSYGWCTTTEEILRQNLEHITVSLSVNGKELGSDVVHPLSFTRPDGLVCLDQGALMSEWPSGEYTLEAAANFDEKINDGLADYAAGDYVFEYHVTVK